MDLLSGVKASDTRDGDISSKIKVFLKDQTGQYTEISSPKNFMVQTIGILPLKYQVSDNNNNTTASEISLNITSGLPIIFGLENLQAVIDPKTDTPINLLTGVRATDAKDIDISSNITVFIKNP